MAFQISVKVTGVEAILKKLSEAGKAYRDRINQIMREEMESAVAEAQSVAAGRGWMLADTIQVVFFSPEEMLIVAGVLAPYAGFPEFGTVKQHAQPYWRPAVWSHFFDFYRRTHEAIKEFWERK